MFVMLLGRFYENKTLSPSEWREKESKVRQSENEKHEAEKERNSLREEAETNRKNKVLSSDLFETLGRICWWYIKYRGK